MDEKELLAQQNRDKLFDVVTNKGYYTDSKEQFHKDYASTPEVQKELFDKVKSEGLYSKTFPEFQEKYFLDVNKNLVLDKTTGTLVSKKKETGGGDSVVPSPTGLPQATTTNTENNTPITPIVQQTTSPTNALVDGASAVLPVTEQTVVKTEPIKNPIEQMQARLEELATLTPAKPKTATDQTNSWEANLREIATKNAPNLTAHLEKLHTQKESDIALLKERKDKGLITQTEYDRQAKFYEEDMQKKAYEPIAKARAEINVSGDTINDVDKRILAAADLLSSEKYTKAHDKPEMDALKEIKDEAFNSYKGFLDAEKAQNAQAALENKTSGASGELADVMAGTTDIKLGGITGKESKVLDSIRAKYGIKPEDAAKLSNEGTLQAFLKKGIVPTSQQVEEYQKTTLAEIRKTHPALQDGDIAAIRTDLLQRAAALPQQEKVENQMKKEMTALGIKAPEQLVKEFTDKVAVVNTNYTKTLDLIAGGLINANKQLDSQYKNDTAEYNKKSVEALTPLQGVIQTKKQELESAYQALQAQMDSRQLTGEQANQAKVVMDAKTQEYNALVDEYNKQQKALQTGYLDIGKAYSQQKTKLQQSITSQSVKLEEVKKAAIANIERLKKEHNITTDQAGEMGFTPEYQQKYASLLEQVYKQDELDKTAQKNKDWDNLNFGQKLGISLSKGLLQVAEMSAMGAKYFAPGHDAADFALQDMAHFREQLPDKSIGEFEFNKLLSWDGAEWLLHKGIEQAPLTLGLAGIGGKAFFAAKGMLGANFPALSNAMRTGIASVVGGGASRIVESNMEAWATFDNALKEGKSYADAVEDANTVRNANMALMVVDAFQTYNLFSRSSKLTALTNPAYKRLGIVKRGGYFSARMAANIATEGGEEVYQEYLQAKVSNPMLSFSEFAASPQGKEVFALGGVMGATFSVGGRMMYGRDQIATINDQISEYFDSYHGGDVNLDDLNSRLTQLKHTVQTLEERGALTQEEANAAKFQLEHQSDVYRQSFDGVLPFGWDTPQMKEYSAHTLEAKIMADKAAQAKLEGKGVVEIEAYNQAAKNAESEANKIVAASQKSETPFTYTVDGTPMSREEFEQFAFDENNADAIEASGAVLESDDPTTNLKLQKFGTVEKRATLDAVDYMDRLYPDRSNSARFATEFRKNQAKALAAGKVEEAKKWEVAATQAEEASTFDNQEIKAAQNAIQKEITALEQNKKTTNAILPNVRGRNNRIKELRKLHNSLGVYHDVQTQAKTVGEKVAGQKSKLEQQAMANAKTQTAPKEEATADKTSTVEPIENIEQLPVEGGQPFGNSEELPIETAVTPEVTAVTTPTPPQETPTSAKNAPVRSEFHSNRARKFANRGRDIHYEGVKDLPEGSIVERDNNRIIVGKKTVGEDGSVSIEVTHQTRKDEKSPWEGDRKTYFGRDKMNNQNGNTPVLMRGYGTDRINVTTPIEYQPTAKELHEDKLDEAKSNKKSAEKALKDTKRGKNPEAIAEAKSRLDKANKELEDLIAANPEEETVAETKTEPANAEVKEEVAPEKPIVETAPPATETTKEEPIAAESTLPKTEPTKLDDTPIDAAADRKRGYRIRNRIRYNRQSTTIPDKVVGSPAFVRFNYKPTGRVEGHFVLMEADDVQPSHQSGMENPLHFIGEGQPKDRTKLADAETTKAATLKPEDLGHSPNAYYGAPVVNERGEGVQGNGRAGALKLYYNTSSYNDGRYQQWLSENAYQFGFSAEQVAKFKNPILVRMVPASDTEAIQLGSYTDADLQDKAQRGAEEKGKIRRLSEKEVVEMVEIITKEGEEDDTLNEAIQRNAKELIPFLVSKGILTELEAKEGMTTGRADAVLAGQIEKLVKELFLMGAIPNLTDIFDKLKDGNENDIVGNMIRNIPLLLLLPQVIKNGFHNALLGIRDFLNNSAPISKEATKITKEALIKRGMTAEAAQIQAEKVFYAKRFAAWANQSAMAFGSSQKGSSATLSPIELEIVKFFAQIAPTLKNANKTKLAKVYRDFLSNILGLSNTNIPTNQTDMFGGATTETTRDLSPAEVIGTALNQMLPESDKINVQTLSINQQQYEQTEADKLRVQSELEGEIGESETKPANVSTPTDVGNAETNASGEKTVSENDGNGQDVVGQSNATTSESEGIGAEGKGIGEQIESVAESGIDDLAAKNDEAVRNSELPNAEPKILDAMLQDGAISQLEHEAVNRYLIATTAGVTPNKIDALFYHAVNNKIKDWWATKFAPANNTETKVKEAKKGKKKTPPKETTNKKELSTAEKKAAAAQKLKDLLKGDTFSSGFDIAKGAMVVAAGVEYGYYWLKEKLENGLGAKLNRNQWEKDMQGEFGDKAMDFLRKNDYLDAMWEYPIPKNLDTTGRVLEKLVADSIASLMAKDQPRTTPTIKQARPATQERATRISKPPLQYVQAENTPDANEYVPQALYGTELDEHQRFAVNLALTNFFDNKKRGFMLADSMGVGKTRQILALAQEYAKRTGKKVLIITERQSIIDTSFIPDAKAMGIDPSQFEMTTYNQLDARADRQFGEYGLVIYDESQSLKNPGKRYNKTRDIKTDHVAYSSATPADRIGSTIYYLSDILGVTPAKMMEELGVKPNSESGQWESTGTVSSADAVQKINDWTQQAFKEGAMIRREYPFWGTIQENSVMVLPKNADGTYTEEGARMALEYQQVSDAYDNSIKSVKPGRYVRNDHQYDEKGVYLGVDEQTITTDGWRKSFAEYRGLSDVQADMLDEQEIKELREQKINMLDKLVESYKATVIVQDIVNQLNNGNAVVLMTQTVNEIEISGLRGKKDNKEKRKSLLMAVKEQLQQRGIEFVEMTGNSDKTQAIKDFQSGKVNVVLGSTQSMAAGVSLDASSPEMRPRVLMIPSPSYSADQFTQAMGRVSRRNTVIPATVSVIYAMDEAIPSDRAKQGKVEKKGSLLQVAQGYGLPQEYKDRLENEKQITARTKGEKPKNATAPTIRVLESGKSFVVENSYDIKESLKKLGGVWNAKEKAWMFKMSQKATIEEWLANNEKATQGIISGNEQATNEAISDMEQSENDAYYEDNMGYDSSQPQELTDTELNAIDDQDARSYKATQRANPRIQIAPQDSGNPIQKEQDMLIAIKKKFGLILSKLPQNKSKKTLGYYSPQTQEVANRNPNDFDTLIHELGHFLDDMFGIAPTDGALDTELAKFWVWGSPAKGKGQDARQKYRRAEGIAEFVRALMLNPSIAKVNAPGLWLQYQAKVPKEVQDAIAEFGKQLRNNAAKSAHEIFQSKQESTVSESMQNAERGFTGRLWAALKSWWRPDTTLPQFDQNRFGLTKWQKFKRQFSNRFAFFEAAVDKMEEIKKSKFLPGADPRILARLASSSHSKAGDMMENGVHDLTRGEDAVAEYQQLITELLDIKKNIGFANPTDEQTAAWIKTNYKGKNKGELMAYLANPEAYKNSVSGQGMARYKDPETGDIVTFKYILEPLRKDTASTLANDMEEVLSYMMAERVLELEKRGLNNGTILGLAGNTLGKMDKALAEQRIKDVEGYEDARKQAIKEAARRYRVFADAMLKYMVGKGRMSQDQYNNIKKNNEFYVALRRVYELSVGESTDGASFDIFGRDDKGQLVGNPIRAIKGSTRTIKDNPYEQLIESMNAIVRESDRSEVTNAFFDIVRDVTNMRAGMYDGAPLFIGDIAIKRELPENYSGDLNKERLVVTFNKGVKEFWYIPDAGLYESIVQIGKIIKANHPLLSALNSAMRLVRMSITKFLTFGWNNFKRDVWQRFINSRTINNAKDGLKAFIQALEAFLPIPIFTHIASYRGKFDKPKSTLAAFGGDQSGTFQNEMAFDKMLARQIRAAVRGNKKGKLAKAASYLGFNAGGIIPGVKTAFGNFWQSYEGVLDNLESKTRIDEFNSAFKHAKEKLGYNDKDANMYAAFQARDLMDFAKHGEFMYYVNQVLLFSNASVQGLSRTMQSFKENKAAFAFKALLGVALPSMIMLALSRMGDYEDEYDELRPYMRNMFYNFKLPGLTGAGTWVRVPKPFEVGVAGAVFERMANYWGLIGKANPHAFDGYWGSLKRAMIPIFGNTDNPFEVLVALSATKPLTEVMFNHDMFRDQSIVSPFEENLHVSMRKGTERASELGKVLADNPLTNLLFGGAQDPRYADHLITGYFGYFGRLAQDVGQVASGEPTKNSGKVDIPETPFMVDWMLEKTGAFRGQNSFQIEALNQVGKIAKDYGLAQTETAKQLKALADDYTALPNNTPAKEAAFSKLLKASRVVRDRWEAGAPQYQQWKESNPNALPLEKKMKLQEFFGTNIQ
jgi:hypothetical protein